MDDKLKMVALHLSAKCGARCSFCYAAETIVSRQENMSIGTVERVLRHVTQAGVSEVLFVGGDPAIYPDLPRALQIAKDLGLSTSFLSNSWDLRPRSEFDHILSLIDSCEATVLGNTPELHDELTGQRGSYQTLMTNLRRVSGTERTIGICLNAMPQNLHFIYDTVASLIRREKLRLRGIMFQRIIPSGGSGGKMKFGLNLDDMEVLMPQVDRIATDFGLPITFEDPVPWCTVPERYHKYLNRCDWGYSKGSISPTAELNRCGADDQYRLGSVFSGSLQHTWQTHPVLVSFRSKEYLADECKSCEYLDRCGGGCPLSCGTATDHDVDFLYLQRKAKEERGSYQPDLVDTAMMKRPRLRAVFPQDWQRITELEKNLFPDVEQIFNPGKLEALLSRYPQGLFLAEDAGVIVGYASMFPLTEAGKTKALQGAATSVCSLGITDIAVSTRKNAAAIFLEVLAFDPSCPWQLRLQTWRELIRRLNGFQGMLLSCAVSSAGERLLARHGFSRLSLEGPARMFSRTLARKAPLLVEQA